MNYNIDFDFGNGDTMYLTHSFHPYPAKFPHNSTFGLFFTKANEYLTRIADYSKKWTATVI